LLEPTGSAASTDLKLEFTDTDSTVWIDNVEFYEANITKTNPQDVILFDYNATSTNKTISLTGTWYTLANDPFYGSITIQPYSSVLLFKGPDLIVNHEPIIYNQSFSVYENTANATDIGTVSATDPNEGQTLTYSIVSGNTSSAFALDSATGELSVANSAILNYELVTSFPLVIKVQDDGEGTLESQATITVTILNVNEAPTIGNQTFSVFENSMNGTVAGTVVATDPDAGQSKSFSILSGNTSNAFAINASTGAISVATSSALDYAVNPSFSLRVKVQDPGVLSDTATITITVTQSINLAPEIANQNFSIIGLNIVNGLYLPKVVATDPNAGQTLAYRIVSGNTSSSFIIDPVKGVLMVNNATYIKSRTAKYFDLVIMATDSGGKNTLGNFVKLSSTAVVRVYTKP
jgi:hypothetical protein